MIRQGCEYHIQAVAKFKVTWQKYVEYWGKKRPQDNVQDMVLDIL